MQNLPFDHLFCNFIPGQSLSGKLDALVIEHAELSREERTLTLWLFSEVYLTQKDEAALKDGLQAQYGLRRVELNLRFPESLLPNMDFRDLAQVFIKAYSPAAGSLAGAKYELENNKLTIHLPANGKADLEPHIPKAQNFLKARFGTSPEIEITAHSALEGRALFDETARIRRETMAQAPAVQVKEAAKKTSSTSSSAQPSGDMIFGRPFGGEVVKMKDLNLDMYRVVVAGKVFAVNRKGEDVLGVPGYTDVREIPGDVDLGVLSVPSAGILDVAEACGQKGVPALVCITAGFREIGPEGAAREKELMRIVDKYNMRIVGPNCMGVANTAPGVRLSATILSETPPVGSVAFLTQSGVLGASLIDFAGELDVGFSVVVSMGNMTNVNPCDLLPMLEADENTKIVCMYMETIPEPYRFERVMSRMTKPVIVVKSGRTTKGAAAASSHTGSLAGNDNVADALLKKCGVIRAENLEDAFLLASSMTKMPRLRGNRVGIISNAGGLGTLTTDALVKYGFELPELSSEERAELAAKLLPEASTHNPLDLVAPAPPAHYAIAAHAMIDSGKYDAIIVDCVPPATIDTGEVAQAMVDILKSTSIPIFSCFFGPTLGAAGRAVMKKGGIPTFSFPDQMVRTMRYMVQPEEAACDSYDCHICAQSRTEARRLMEHAESNAYLPAEDCFRLLKLYNVPMAQSAYLPAGGMAASLALDYPVVAKVDHPEIIHKSDVGGVRLGIQDAAALDALLAEWTARFPGLRGIQVQQQISGNLEMIIGASVDPALGHSILTGLGGTLVEILKDVSFGHVPLSSQDPGRMLRSLRSYRLLEGYRGSAKANIEQFRQILMQVNQLLLDFPAICEMDMNPLIFDETRGAFYAVDARIKIS